MGEKVGPLKKVTLSLEAGTTEAAMDLTEAPLDFEFIYGLGPAGLTPFEKELAQKGEGEEVVYQIRRGDIEETFEHLALPLTEVPDYPERFYLKVRIDRVVAVDQREVIGAMAEVVNCGEHCCGH